MPKKEKRDTKEIILKVALKLFSEKGYDGVGIRDISKEIGIRESAIYKHYSGKQDIFNSILKDIDHRYHEEVTAFIPAENMNGIHLEKKDERDELFHICVSMFRFYLKTDYGSQLRRMLTMEQFRTSEASSIFRELIIDKGLNDISDIFINLIKEEVYIKADPTVMALQFYSPLYLLLSKYDKQPDKYEEALSLLERHITQFNAIYSRGDE